MSRTIITSNQIYLSAQQTAGNVRLIISPSQLSHESICLSRDELFIFRLLMLHVLHVSQGYEGLLSMVTILPLYDINMQIFSFLYADIVKLVVPAPILLPHQQLEMTASAFFYDASSPISNAKTAIGWLIDYSNKRNRLQNAAVNADIETLRRIIRNTHPENRNTLLSTPEGAHYSETRLDTALKIALANDDVEMVVVINEYLDPLEFKRQCENVYQSGFSTFQKTQKKEAKQLLKSIRDVFACEDETKSIEASTQFKNELDTYVKAHFAHNPFIFEHACRIYHENWELWSVKTLHLFAIHVIGSIQENSSAAWKMRYCSGIFMLAYEFHPQFLSKRTFLPKNGTDIHSLNLGSDCCIDIYGNLTNDTNFYSSAGAMGKTADCVSYVTTILSCSTLYMEGLMGITQSQRSQNQPGCCAIQ